jgi:predicted DCC family thiol-disulfide oxidoreductase YuxK
MKTLNNHIIVYDDECPMCDLYTRAFVRSKMLEKEGRLAFSEVTALVGKGLDPNRSGNEIALIDLTTGKVTYGIDSLFTVIGNAFPVTKLLFACSPFRWLAKQAYSFISYNRKVIVPAKSVDAARACTPDFNLKYRIAYILFAWLLVATVVHAYAKLLVPIVPPGGFMRELILSGGQIPFQALALSFLSRKKLMNYLGNMVTVTIIGALMLLPVLLLAHWGIVLAPVICAGYLLLVVGAMVLEHLRRVKLLGITGLATVSWIVYRVLALFVIL